MALFPATTVTRDVAKCISVGDREAVSLADFTWRLPNIGRQDGFRSKFISMRRGGERIAYEQGV